MVNYTKSIFTFVFLFSCFTLSGMRVEPESIESVVTTRDGAVEIDLKPELIASKEMVFMPRNQRFFAVGWYPNLKKQYLVEPFALGSGLTVKMKTSGSTEWTEQTIKSDCGAVCVSCHPKYPLLFFCEKKDKICVWDLGKQESLGWLHCEDDVEALSIKESGEMLIKCAGTNYHYYNIDALVDDCNKRHSVGKEKACSLDSDSEQSQY
jgi:hypothetical protein